MRRGYIHRASFFRRRFGRNVGQTERVLSVVAALGLALFGRRRRQYRKTAAIASGFLLRRGLSGRCPLYARIGLSSH
jgi:hypothetical protein